MADTPQSPTSTAEQVELFRAAATRLSVAARTAGAPLVRWTRDTSPADKGYTFHENVVVDGYNAATCEGGSTPPGEGREDAATADANLIALGQPVVALAVASWLDAEATMLDSIEPVVALWNGAIEAASGVVDMIRVGTDANGQIAMQFDSSASALHLARTVLAVGLPPDPGQDS